MENQKLIRSQEDKMIAGVCAGLAHFFGMDVSIARIIYALLTCFTAFAGLPIYLLLWLIIPQESNPKLHD